ARFAAFERNLENWVEERADATPVVTLVGSGDFHHITLAFLRRLKVPFNLLVLDKHPDWMRGVPFLHCGTWLHHAVQFPHLRRVFHVGGDLDFDNRWRWLAPWRCLKSGKIIVIPAVRRYRSGAWPEVRHQPLRVDPDVRIEAKRVRALLAPYRGDL